MGFAQQTLTNTTRWVVPRWFPCCHAYDPSVNQSIAACSVCCTQTRHVALGPDRRHRFIDFENAYYVPNQRRLQRELDASCIQIGSRKCGRFIPGGSLLLPETTNPEFCPFVREGRGIVLFRGPKHPQLRGAQNLQRAANELKNITRLHSHCRNWPMQAVSCFCLVGLAMGYKKK